MNLKCEQQFWDSLLWSCHFPQVSSHTPFWCYGDLNDITTLANKNKKIFCFLELKRFYDGLQWFWNKNCLQGQVTPFSVKLLIENTLKTAPSSRCCVHGCCWHSSPFMYTDFLLTSGNGWLHLMYLWCTTNLCVKEITEFLNRNYFVYNSAGAQIFDSLLTLKESQQRALYFAIILHNATKQEVIPDHTITRHKAARNMDTSKLSERTNSLWTHFTKSKIFKESSPIHTANKRVWTHKRSQNI